MTQSSHRSFQIASRKVTMETANVAHDATGKLFRKKNSEGKRSSYQEFEDREINYYIQTLILTVNKQISINCDKSNLKVN